ncbi:hypothetical protein GGP41_006844 [Bipolaris sorokiniana]|uniref:Uncharacterized protein n=1 Tax=Cochliobolus sativus TaxID=45130 RepID=A0A8H5ZUD2_COCSA|nr:hypothetical protein GGP41_006844 [Bipolaris sorokiniana]
MQRNSSSLDLLSDEERESFPLTGRRQARQNGLRYRVAVMIATASLLLLLTASTLTRTQSPARDVQHRLACSTHKEDCETTAPFIFDTVHSLLKQWPNTYGPNGHSIVAATVPLNTQLYHARPDGKPPKVPTFFAFDAEMSLGIYASSGTPTIYTMTTTKPLKVLYFDGQAASLTHWGTLDSQMALLKNKVPDNPSERLVFDEDQRARELCTLLKSLSIDGTVRMNAGFEVLICDYVAAGVRQVHVSNITVPGNMEREHDPSLPRDPNRVPPLGYGNEFAPQNSWEWIRSGTWHYGTGEAVAGGNKETRVSLDLCGFITYYDPFLRSLSGHHHSQQDVLYQNGWGLRRGHRLLGISADDIGTVKSWLKQITALGKQDCSGIDWQALTETIVKQHGTRAREMLATVRHAVKDNNTMQEALTKIHELTHAVLYTYLEYPTAVGISPAAAKKETISRCSRIYTDHVDSNRLNDFEVIIRDSIQVLMHKLCSWEFDLFALSDRYTSDLFDPKHELVASSELVSKTSVRAAFDYIRTSTEELMEWIGWDSWHGCEHRCAFNELCYIPMWPVIYAPGKHQGGIFADDSYTEAEMSEFWRPKCINRTLFDQGGGRAREPSHQLPDVPSHLPTSKLMIVT